ncbi:neurotrimin isoform X1 [Monomorium pharaonis]|uniref:neurotrimin isoform X1 n=2 Tax=Monomorium pharaonis TaxID=307658 RepID=UPI00063F08BD|nr:neurotrimin isoform X1 [Monomorium pharaonis]
MIMGEKRAVLCPRRRQVPLLVVTTLLVGVRTELVDPKFKEPIANVTAPVGREAILSCVVQDLAGYKVAWLRVDTQTILTIASHVITKNHRIAVSHSDHRTWFLHIREVRESDRGWYMCQINTDPMKSQIGYLEVVVPPDILDYDTSTDMVVMEGRNVTLRCAATGSPAPNITWRREDGQQIQLGNGEEVVSVDGPSFNITKVNRLHMGSYLCIASNGVPPSVSKRIMLTVHFPPMIWVQNQLVGAHEGQKLTLECHSEAFPKSINYWTRDQDKIVPQGGKYDPVLKDNAYKIHMKLTINSVSPTDYGSYKCVSRNSLGDTDGSIKVYPISNSNSNSTKYKGKARHNSGNNNILEGNQDMLKERDLELRGRKQNGGDVADYDESSATSNGSSLLLVILVALCLCLHHHPQIRTLHPA